MAANGVALISCATHLVLIVIPIKLFGDVILWFGSCQARLKSLLKDEDKFPRDIYTCEKNDHRDICQAEPSARPNKDKDLSLRNEEWGNELVKYCSSATSAIRLHSPHRLGDQTCTAPKTCVGES
jgi:hypothetical protein